MRFKYGVSDCSSLCNDANEFSYAVIIAVKVTAFVVYLHLPNRAVRCSSIHSRIAKREDFIVEMNSAK